jgi:hypothetical protein
VTSGQTLAYNVAPTAVASSASTKQIGLIGTSESDAVLYDSQALTGTAPVTFNDTFKTVTFILTGDVESTVTVTVKKGAADPADRQVGVALSTAAAAGDRILAYLNPVLSSAESVGSGNFGGVGLIEASKAVVANTDAAITNTGGDVKIHPRLSAADMAGKTVKIGSITNTGTANSLIGFQSKPAQGASTAQNVIGCEISPRVNDTFALTSTGTLIGAHVDAYLKGTTGDIGGDVRGLQIELVTDDAGARDITGNVSGIRIRMAFSAGTVTGNIAAIRIEKPETQTNSENYGAVLELTDTLAGVWNDAPGTEPTTADGYIKVLVNGNARYIQLYSGAPAD